MKNKIILLLFIFLLSCPNVQSESIQLFGEDLKTEIVQQRKKKSGSSKKSYNKTKKKKYGAPKAGKTTKRCQAKTKAGEQCKRNAEPGSSYCWQHKKK